MSKIRAADDFDFIRESINKIKGLYCDKHGALYGNTCGECEREAKAVADAKAKLKTAGG